MFAKPRLGYPRSKSSKFKQSRLRHRRRTGEALGQDGNSVDAVELDRAIDVYTQSYHGQTISKTSECNALLKFCMLESWFGENRPITLKTLSLRANLPESTALRLLRKGVAKGRYIASPQGYLPSFSIAQDVAIWLQAAHIPFCLTAGKYHIQCDGSYYKFAADYLLTQQKYAPNLGATSQLLLLHLIRRELVQNLESTATDLSVVSALSKSTVSDTQHLLTDRGHVVTTKDVTDERRSLLWLNLSEAHSEALNKTFSSILLPATVNAQSPEPRAQSPEPRAQSPLKRSVVTNKSCKASVERSSSLRSS